MNRDRDNTRTTTNNYESFPFIHMYQSYIHFIIVQIFWSRFQISTVGLSMKPLLLLIHIPLIMTFVTVQLQQQHTHNWMCTYYNNFRIHWTFTYHHMLPFQIHHFPLAYILPFHCTLSPKTNESINGTTQNMHTYFWSLWFDYRNKLCSKLIFLPVFFREFMISKGIKSAALSLQIYINLKKDKKWLYHAACFSYSTLH